MSKEISGKIVKILCGNQWKSLPRDHARAKSIDRQVSGASASKGNDGLMYFSYAFYSLFY